MGTQRMTAVGGLVLAGVLAAAACGGGSASVAGLAGAANGAVPPSEVGDCYAGHLVAEGSSAQKSAFEEAVNSYTAGCQDAKISYNPSGSGAGIRQFIAGQVAFAGSDSPLRGEPRDGRIERDEAAAACGSPAWNLPLVTGPLTVAYNVEGLGKLVLTPKVVAEIFSGGITAWNDPAIAVLNRHAKLPADPIKVFFRSDESGTTENFTRYLKAAAAADWPAEPAKRWSGRVGEGKEKSAGVTQGVIGTKGGITYVEWSYAQDGGLDYAEIDNGSGPVQLTSESVGAAVSAATQSGQGNDLALTLDYATKKPGAYPILLVTYEVVCSRHQDAHKAAGIRSFLRHFSSSGFQHSLSQLGYAPLPDGVRTKVASAVAALS